MAAPLDELVLTAAVRRVASLSAPLPLQLEAARGHVPLAPADLLTALYQLLHVRPEAPQRAAVREAALTTAMGVPDAVLLEAFAQPLEEAVIDFFGRTLLARPALAHQVLSAPATRDPLVAILARHADEVGIGLIAAQEDRLARHPAILTALYHNPRTPMSTATRLIAWAAERKIAVEPLSQDEIHQLKGEPAGSAADDHFRRALHVDGENQHGAPGNVHPEKTDLIKDLSVAAKVRLALLGGPFARSILIRDPIRIVSLAAIRSPSVGDNEVVRYAANRDLHEDVIRYIAGRASWVRLYSVKLALVHNPKTPVALSMRLLAHLQTKDLRLLARSKGIPMALARAAKGILETRND